MCDAAWLTLHFHRPRTTSLNVCTSTATSTLQLYVLTPYPATLTPEKSTTPCDILQANSRKYPLHVKFFAMSYPPNHLTRPPAHSFLMTPPPTPGHPGKNNETTPTQNDRIIQGSIHAPKRQKEHRHDSGHILSSRRKNVHKAEAKGLARERKRRDRRQKRGEKRAELREAVVRAGRVEVEVEVEVGATKRQEEKLPLADVGNKKTMKDKKKKNRRGRKRDGMMAVRKEPKPASPRRTNETGTQVEAPWNHSPDGLRDDAASSFSPNPSAPVPPLVEAPYSPAVPTCETNELNIVQPQRPTKHTRQRQRSTAPSPEQAFTESTPPSPIPPPSTTPPNQPFPPDDLIPLTPTQSFLAAMQAEQSTLVSQTEVLLAHVETLKSTRFNQADAMAAITRVERKIELTSALCFDLFIAEGRAWRS
ncbi:uncharacterized protein K460DRAFT_119287 [Cucurbitaria berberidis CBS 394.84]|uniref:Uncharacterized protein n=1 Tax=Cucurbitaria berberidis CBS 394.84 TaxID=1168544 RepID=A0A9P4GJ25_9PLEO|nr:uncharacterized protein K460DRAFT_119287 [Cucurbitaria berberidis CBS 394.84]KAF1846040.1 hypothetical protein K460DRAFT_119287 [Cucurbitaria berberidis CBS 394.84]